MFKRREQHAIPLWSALGDMKQNFNTRRTHATSRRSMLAQPCMGVYNEGLCSVTASAFGGCKLQGSLLYAFHTLPPSPPGFERFASWSPMIAELTRCNKMPIKSLSHNGGGGGGKPTTNWNAKTHLKTKNARQHLLAMCTVHTFFCCHKRRGEHRPHRIRLMKLLQQSADIGVGNNGASQPCRRIWPMSLGNMFSAPLQ